MATKVVTSHRFPPGTAVRAYPLRSVNLERMVSINPMVATATDEEVIDANYSCTITGDPGEYALLGVVNEVQRITVDATAGQIKLTFSGQQTADIAFNASAATMKTALEALSNIAPGDVEVTGGPGSAGGGTPYFVTFRGVYAGGNVGQMTAANGTTPLSGGAATVVVATDTQGAPNVLDSDGEYRWVIFRID